MNPVNGEISFWQAQLGRGESFAPLRAPASVDVCIVGAGLTGLWTAYYLKQEVPILSIAVIEQRCVGFGASGRNGGWLNAAVAGSLSTYAAKRGETAARELQRAMIETVDEVIAVAGEEGIDADIVKGGVLRVARTPAQFTRLERMAEAASRWGDPQVLLDESHTRSRVAVEGALGGLYSEHGARVHPAKLVHGLADAVTRMGVTIYESTPALEIRPHRVLTPAGAIAAKFVVRATEGFSASFKELHRLWLPMNSSMIVTEPLPDSLWEEIGWCGAEVLGDSAHTFMYAQRTADNRIAVGGRGVPYQYASRIDRDGATPSVTVEELRSVLTNFFPVLGHVGIAHAWSGVLGVPRDWCATVGLDRSTGIAAAGGYAGHGVAATNLAGRTLRDLIMGRDSALTQLPWVDWRTRRWEPEPLRWLGVRSLYLAYRMADRVESSGRPTTSIVARAANFVSGL
jgi:glycine/D-amino acid oxidase-like deaminating enzyme